MVILAAACVWPAGKSAGGENHGMRTETVERVIDGDTLVLVGGERVRLAGIDAPPLRSRDGAGLRAREFLENLCPPGATVLLDPDDLAGRDPHGRLLAVVHVPSGEGMVNVNAELLRRGYAEVMFLPPTEFNPYKWLEENHVDTKAQDS